MIRSWHDAIKYALDNYSVMSGYKPIVKGYLMRPSYEDGIYESWWMYGVEWRRIDV